MAIGDVFDVSAGTCSDLSYVDTGMYDTEGYGCVYLIDAERPALVDTGIGTNYERILAAMDEVGIARDDLAVIAVTHVHLDHAGGAGFLAEACPNATVHVHEIGAPHVIDPEQLVEGTKRAVDDQWQYYTEPKPVPASRVTELTGGDVIDLGDRELRAHYAPGHAPHQLVFEEPDDDVVFTADAAGIYASHCDTVLETSPPSTFDLEQCLADVKTIQEIDPAVLCYAHFGPAPTDDRLTEYTNALTEWVGRVAEKRSELDDDEAVREFFADTTDLDDVWGERKGRAEARINTRGVLGYLDQRETDAID